MAKDKEFENVYKIIGRERLNTRILKRKEKAEYYFKLYGPHRSKAICPYCKGLMSWCHICEEYSSNCCIEYGTCQCS